MQWLLREQTKHFEFALVYGSYVLMTGITMSFSGVVDTIMPRLHNSSTFRRVASPSPGSLFFDTLRAGSGAVTIAKRSFILLSSL
jgi:hypothetical protein